MTELAQIVAGWPLVLSMAAAVAAQSLRAGRRRSALNEALHELRRPLQAVAFASGPRFEGAAAGDDPMELAAAALERLDHEINGGALPAVWGTVDAAALARAAVARWQARVSLTESSLDLRWNAGHALIRGDRVALSQALDNLIVNAIEHGGPTIVVAARLRGGCLRMAVVDSGRARRRRSRLGRPSQALARIAGERHGHGLGVVRRVASEHAGRFALRRSEQGTLAVLEIPLADSGDGLAA